MGEAIKGATGLEQALRDREHCSYVLCLYVSGLTPLSLRAIANTKKFCETHLPGRYDLRIVDVYQQPQALRTSPLVAAPTLIKETPLPVQLFIGDMSQTGAVQAALGLPLDTPSEKEGA